jgi:hypothetical protein
MIRVVRIPRSGSMYVLYTAWEPAVGIGNGLHLHSSLTSDEAGNILGRVGTRRLPEALARLPDGPERRKAIDRFLAEQFEAAYAAIIAEFPEADLGERYRGMIETPRCILSNNDRAALRELGAEVGAHIVDSFPGSDRT